MPAKKLNKFKVARGDRSYYEMSVELTNELRKKNPKAIVSPQTIEAWEKGRAFPRHDNLVVWCRVTRTKPNDYYDFERV